MSPVLAVAFTLAEEDGTDETRAAVERRLDTATGFLIEAIQDDDGRFGSRPNAP